MTLSVNKMVMYWTAIFLLELAFVLIFRGENVFPTQNLEMTSVEAELTREAISLILEDMERGTLCDTDRALGALRAELPSSVGDKVMRRIGAPNFDELPSVLTTLSEKIVIQNEGTR